MKSTPSVRLFTERLLPWLVLAVLIVFSYATFFQIPYVGFDFNPTDGRLTDVFIEAAQGNTLQPGDRLVRVNSLSWIDFRADARRPLFQGVEKDEVVPLEIERDGRNLSISWVLPGPNLPEVVARLLNLWLLAYVFWAAGTATILFLRPKDTRWLLFTAFYHLTAIWLITGNISRWQIWGSATLMSAVIWLCVPVYLHLHWIFPEPLGRIPRPLLWGGYLTAAGLAVSQWIQILPRNSYALGFLLAVAGTIGFLILHFIRQPLQRRVVGQIATAVGLVILPSIGVSIARLIDEIPSFGGGALLALPVLPAVYFYAVYRRQFGKLELRANRLIALYLFFILLGSVFLVLLAIANTWLVYPASPTFNAVSAVILSGVITALFYPPFKRFVERYLLGMPLPPDHLLETYPARITTSLDLPTLVDLLRAEVLPSLLIHQSALLRIEEGRIEPLLVSGVDGAQLPKGVDIPELLDQAGKFRAISLLDERLRSVPWVRLVLPLRVGERLIGFWLLGSRAPDDFYAQSELPILQALANQTAIALANIAQSAQLRAIYQTNIDRYEQERTKLARDLHDDILNRLVVLGMYVDLTTAIPRFTKAYRELIEHIRQAISGLRPPMLHYGLLAALEELVDELSEHFGNEVTIELEVPASQVRYEPGIEQHLYRIVQQAIENALRHARAKTIRISGSLEQDSIKLIVVDDGIGFETCDRLEITRLLTDGHFGLVGMLERARLIGADLDIRSSLGSGTQLSVVWRRF